MTSRAHYLLVAVVVLGFYVLVAILVSLRLFAAPQLDLLTKSAVLALLWGFCIYGVYIFRKHLPPKHAGQ